MSLIITKIEKLIRLATDVSATLEEARSAAHAACKLIVEHDLILAPKRASSSGSTPSEPPTNKPSESDIWEWIRNAGFENSSWDWIRDEANRASGEGRPSDRRKARGESKVSGARGVDGSRHVVVTRMPFLCAVCASPQQREDRVAKRDSDGSRICITCWSKGLGYGDYNGDL